MRIVEPPNPEWAPRYWTSGAEGLETFGHEAETIANSLMVFERGISQGEVMTFLPFQRWLIDSILARDEDNCGFYYRDALIMIPKKNSKSMLSSVLAIWAAVTADANSNALILLAAGSREQAGILFKTLKNAIDASPRLQKVTRVTRRNIMFLHNGAEIRVVAAVGTSAQGLSPILVIADELYGWKGDRAEEFFSALRNGSGDRGDGGALMVSITTAGHYGDNLLTPRLRHGIDLATREVIENDDNTIGGRAFFAMWGADEDDDWTDEEIWKTSNPLLAAGVLSISEMRTTYQLAEATLQLNEFARYNLNVMSTSGGGMSFISAARYDANIIPGYTVPPDGTPISIGIDAGQSADSTAIVGITLETTKPQVIFPIAIIERPKQAPEGWRVEPNEIIDAVNAARLRWKVAQIVYDPYGVGYALKQISQTDRLLERLLVAIPQQTGKRMAEAADFFLAAIGESRIRFSDDATLRRHCISAGTKPDGRPIKAGANRSTNPDKIDGLIAAILANYGAIMVNSKPMGLVAR